MTDLETLRIVFRSQTDDWLKNRYKELVQELEDSRNVTSQSDVGQAFASVRHIPLPVELRAITDVMFRKGLIEERRSPRGAYAFAATARRDL